MVMQPIDQVYMFVFGVMIFSSLLLLIAYLRNRNGFTEDPEPSSFPSVTYLVPAYNEEEHIAETIEKILDQDYPDDRLDIIAINDGSTDGTLEEIKKYEDRIEILDKENTGKANSINQALEQVETELVGCMDGDSFPEPEATRRMVGYFRDEEIKGVTPAMKVRNPENWVEKVIWTEYIYQIFLRKLFAFLDAQYVMPGPGSLYRTDYLKELGGWDEETLTEDMEIAFRMYGSGALLENSTNAYVDTVSPSSLKGLFRQRIRWYRGYLNNFLRYRRFIFNPRYGNLGFIFMPFNAVWTLLVLFMVGHMVFRMGDTILQSAQMYMMLGYVPLGFSFGLQNLSLFHFFYGVLTGTGIIMLLLSIKTAGEELKLWRRKMNYVLFLWIYATLYAGFWIAAVVEEIRGGRTRW